MTSADFLHHIIYRNSVEAWLIAAAVAATVFLVLMVTQRLLVEHLGKVAAETANRLDDLFVEMLRGTRVYVLLFLALDIAVRSLRLPTRIDSMLGDAAQLVLLLQAAFWGSAAINYWVHGRAAERTSSNDRASIAMLSALGIAAKVVLWVLIGFAALETWGVKVTPLITGLGISGIAVALAVQNILGDLLAALAIIFDKPFDLGDTIGVDQIVGTVEHIGLKTTRLRAQTGEQVIIGNGDLLKSRLRNYKRQYQRRVALTLDITYDTPREVIERLPRLLREIVESQSPVKFDRSHVSAFTDSAIRLETVYQVLDPDYQRHMDIQQAVLMRVLEEFAALKVELAYPTRTVLLEPPPSSRLADQPTG